ncbi:uncharacterized protein tasor2 isoform X2 [Syngnathus typhle]|uniref:uncharacterized protein tasor2 isoform X2 n=1 Tax=Syngnathus typhle TaxID=161592 RepID=UPI002A69CF8F|nr:uncharacterized protein tasor2 isoform X2 [Syngnathus typhle]
MAQSVEFGEDHVSTKKHLFSRTGTRTALHLTSSEMESGTDSASSVLIAVSEYSEAFRGQILAPLQSGFLLEESKLSFRYKWAWLVQNPALSQKYAAFRAKRKQAGYSEEDLEETYGFLLLDDLHKANALGQTGLVTGMSSCSSLGDPSKGIYISMFSDCLGPERWRDGQSGYVAIIRLTTGRVKRVCEYRARNVLAPTPGFDCHVSQHLASVSAQTGFSLAFQRTQCYIYELLDDGSHQTAPSLTCPFAVVAFSYQKRRASPMKEPQAPGFGSCQIPRILPVLRLARSQVEKRSHGLCDVATYTLRPSLSLLPAGEAAAAQPAAPLHMGPKGSPAATLDAHTAQAPTRAANDPKASHRPGVATFRTPHVEKSPAAPATSSEKTGSAEAEASVAPNRRQAGAQRLPTHDVPAELVVSFTSEQSVTRKSPAKEPLSRSHCLRTDAPANEQMESPKGPSAETHKAKNTPRARRCQPKKASSHPFPTWPAVPSGAAPLRHGSERCNLAWPVISQCGRVLVPHGSTFSAGSRLPSPPVTPDADRAAPQLATASPERSGEDGLGPQGATAAAEEEDARGRRTTMTKHQRDSHPEALGGETQPGGKKSRLHAQRTASVPNGSEATWPPPAPPPEETPGRKGQIVSRPPSIYPKWKRMKTLRKQLHISREHFQKTWWMHFERPSRAKEALATPKPATDALNLLADLALGADRRTLPSEAERRPRRKSDQRQNGHHRQNGHQSQNGHQRQNGHQSQNGHQRQNAHQSQNGHQRQNGHRALGPKVPLVEGGDLLSLLSKEHAYSLPLWALAGTPFRVAPLSGSGGLLHRPPPPPRASSEEQKEKEHWSSKWSQAFRRHRSFLCKDDGSVAVTRQWKEKYDFSRDSRFSCDPKDRTVLRALHGPWDSSLGESGRDARLVLHMWIGFFYSRSTARLIDFGSERNHHASSSQAENTTSQAQSGPAAADRFALPSAVPDASPLSSTSSTSAPNVAAGAEGTPCIRRVPLSAAAQNDLIGSETTKLPTTVGFTEEGQGEKAEEPFPSGDFSGPRSPTERTEAELVELLSSSPDGAARRAPCRRSVLQVGEIGPPDAAAAAAHREDNLAQSLLIGDPSERERDGPDGVRDVRRADAETLGKRTEKDFLLASPRRTLEESPRRFEASESARSDAAQGPSDDPSDDPPPPAASSPFKADEDRWHVKSASYRFYILATSEDSFFAETKASLEAAGHTAVRPSQFFLAGESSSLLIVVRNEDISAHLSQVPYLLELKKSPGVLFAGIDEPHDLVNRTHQELFLSGGFVVFDGPALEALSLDTARRFSEVLRELNQTEKWKWLLHYRDSRRLKENARYKAR